MLGKTDTIKQKVTRRKEELSHQAENYVTAARQRKCKPIKYKGASRNTKRTIETNLQNVPR